MVLKLDITIAQAAPIIPYTGIKTTFKINPIIALKNIIKLDCFSKPMLPINTEKAITLKVYLSKYILKTSPETSKPSPYRNLIRGIASKKQ